MEPGMHGSTFGGNPVCAAAALAVLQTLTEQDLVGRADVLGKVLSHGIESLNHPLVDHVRGRGLLRGVVLTAPASKRVESAARDAGFLVNAPVPDIVRLAPPLIITETQIDEFVSALPGILDKAST
jgi:acetylornithine aminotransferase